MNEQEQFFIGLLIVLVLVLIYHLCAPKKKETEGMANLAQTWKLDPTLGGIRVHAWSVADGTEYGAHTGKIALPNSMTSVRKLLDDDVTISAPLGDERKDSVNDYSTIMQKKAGTRHNGFSRNPRGASYAARKQEPTDARKSLA